MSQDRDTMTLFPTAASPSLGDSREIRFFVIGTPRPGGSKRAIPLKNGKIAVVEDGRHTKSWREDVQAAARKAYSGPLLLGPLLVTMIFVFRRPQSHYGTGRNRLCVKPSAPRHHTQKPDVLKIARSTEDALTGVLWGDDRQTVRLKIMKRWCDACEAGGCLVMVTPMEVFDNATTGQPPAGDGSRASGS